MAPGDGAVLGGAGNANAGVVLLGGVDPVGELVVDVHAVELGGELVVNGRPAPAAVEGDAGAPVVPLNQVAGIARVYPQVVVVSVGGGHLLEATAAVGGFPHLEVGDVDGVGVAGVGEDVAVVPGPVHQVAVVADPLPLLSAVIRPVEAFLLRFNDRPDPVRLRRRDGHADLALDSLGQPLVVADLGPGVASVGGFEKAAVGPAAGERPEIAAGLPDGGVEQAGVVGVHGQIHRTGLGAAVEHLFPGASAVLGAVDTPFRVGAEGVAQGSHVDQVGIVRMDPDFADMAGLLESQVGPGLAGVGGLVDPVPIGNVQANGGFAGAGVDDVGVRGGHRQGADGGGVEEAVGDVLPVGAAVGGFPHSAGHGSEIGGHGVHRVARNGHHPAAARRADAAPLEVLQETRIVGGGAHERGSLLRAGAPHGRGAAGYVTGTIIYLLSCQCYQYQRTLADKVRGCTTRVPTKTD